MKLIPLIRNSLLSLCVLSHLGCSANALTGAASNKPQARANTVATAEIRPVAHNIASTASPEVTASMPEFLSALRNQPAVIGGLASVALNSRSATPPHVLYEQRRVLVLREGQQWWAFVGIALSAKAGTHRLVDQDTGETYNFSVQAKTYPAQHITVKNQRHVNPNAEDLQRIQQETQQIQAALATPWRATEISPLPLDKPVAGGFSSPFGLQRFFNGQPRKPHSGLDISAPQGAEIHAPTEGIVVNTGDYFFNGNTVFLDHGQSVVTMFCHLDQILVKEGQRVRKGQVIGLVGKTGRATGPHLHWSVSLNKSLIDPKLVLQE